MILKPHVCCHWFLRKDFYYTLWPWYYNTLIQQREGNKYPNSIALTSKVYQWVLILRHKCNKKQYEYLTAQCCIPFQQKIWPQLPRGPTSSCECPYQHNWLETHQSSHSQVVPKGAALRQMPAERNRMQDIWWKLHYFRSCFQYDIVPKRGAIYESNQRQTSGNRRWIELTIKWALDLHERRN